MQALIDLISINDAYKEPMPFLIDIINEVYLPKEKHQIMNAYKADLPHVNDLDAEQYYNETFNS